MSSRLWRRIARQEAARHGVSEAASSPLLWIERLGPPVRQNVLADAVGIESPSLVPLLRELESAGLIDRVADPTDRRAKAVSLTAKGEQVVAAVNADLEALRRQVFADVAAVDLEMRLEELRILQLLRRSLKIDEATIGAIERAAKARHRTLS